MKVRTWTNALLLIALSTRAFAQERSAPADGHAEHDQRAGHEQHDVATPGWIFMQDGALFGMFNHQGGARGGDDFEVPNWWMGMWHRARATSQLTFTAMFSLDAATVGKSGYREIFQVGETVGGEPLVDRQHPHDAFMQLAAIWRRPLTPNAGLTVAGGPVGEPALGPVAFMHRASAIELPMAALGHHTFDSTHIAFGVVTGALDRGRWVIEASLFNGREPDEDRWDFDFGPMDSVSGRVWFRPTPTWELQFSTGHLREPEELETGNVQRTTASASWFRPGGNDFDAVTVAYGVNATDHGTRHASLAEATRRAGAQTWFTRAEVLQLETDLLLGGAEPHTAGRGNEVEDGDVIAALTIGTTRDVLRWRGFEGAFGAALSLYAVPAALKETHGTRPISFQVFFRLRPPAGAMGRMLNMRMSQPMAGHQSMAHDEAHVH